MIGVDLSIASIGDALGWAVVHFLWQGTLIAMITAIMLAFLHRAAPAVRYALTCIAMGACAVVFLATALLVLFADAGVPLALTGSSSAGAAFTPVGQFAGGATPPVLSIETVAWLWCAGVAIFGVRFSLQWLSARRLRMCDVTAADDRWQCLFDSIKQDLGVSSRIGLLRSGLARAPMVVGWLSPVVLVPASAFTSLTPEQLRAVLTHELSHIRRYDHLVNAAQVLIETVLFFHPVVWWLSAQVRLEREHCCDDAAVCASGGPLAFAEALARLESIRMKHPQSALAANGGPLMSRITRVLGSRQDVRTTAPRWRTIIALTAGAIVAAGGISHAASSDEDRFNDPVVEVLRDSVEAGTMTEVQARAVFDSVVYPGSEFQEKSEAEFAKIAEKIEAGVVRGTLSRADADAKLAYARSERGDDKAMAFSVQVLGMTRGEAYMTAMQSKMDRLIESGALTEASAERKMESIRRGVDLREEYGAYVEQAGAKIRESVAAGEITEEQGREKMAGVREGIGKRIKYQQATEEIRAAVEAGTLTEEEARENVESLRHRMAGDHERSDIDWESIKRRIEGAVERGDMTREEADEAYAGMKERMGNREMHEDGVMWRRIGSALAEGGIERDKLRPVMGAMKRIMGEVNSEGDAISLDPRLRAYLVDQGLGAEQIDLVVGLSRRAAAHVDDDDDDEDEVDGAGPDEDGDVEVSLNELPRAIRAAILKHAEGHEIEEIERSPEGRYEVDCGDWEFIVGPDGKFLGEEEDD